MPNKSNPTPTKIKIERGVPLPTYNSARSGQSKYPFQDMKMGNSFFLPGVPRTAQVKICAAYHSFRFSNPTWKFRTTQVKGPVPGARCWRLK